MASTDNRRLAARNTAMYCSLAVEVVELTGRSKLHTAWCQSMWLSFRVPRARTTLKDGRETRDRTEGLKVKGGQLSGNRSLSVASEYAVQHLFNVAHRPASNRRSVEWGWMQQVEEVDSWRGSGRSRAANSHDETLS
jgi:hypothetical protein